ncbi:hypothetical protein KO465_05545 [Candidatus Micrarchaeota archaeon]|jgi:hypothetical protein|nr:hypothetical protein [Candidatus Micrarchaeota archaeon]
MKVLDLKNPEKSALSYKNEEVYLSSYKLSSTLKQIARDRNLIFIIDVNDIVNKLSLINKIQKFVRLCKKYSVSYKLISSGKDWEKRNGKELKFIEFMLEGK